MSARKSIPPNTDRKDEIAFKNLSSAGGLLELDVLLTQLMATQRIQAVIKDDKLEALINMIIEFVEPDDDETALYASSMLGRLAAVARGREMQVLSRVSEIVHHELPSLNVLSDEKWKDNEKYDLGKRKNYAALSLRHLDQDWIPEYCLREAVNIDTAENARGTLLGISLEGYDTISDWLLAIGKQAPIIQSINNDETRIVRARRLFAAILENLTTWKGELGGNPGQALEDVMSKYTRGKFDSVDQEKLFDALDSVLAILVRMIELRFSYALTANTYAAIERGKKILGPGLWGRFLSQSKIIPDLRTLLLETALVLVRQNRTDKQITSVMTACYTSKPQVKAAIKYHFSEAKDLDPDYADWWRCAGDIKENQRKVEHKVGNNEDQQIGALLIEVESNQQAMLTVGNDVVPMLAISDPVSASTLKMAVSGYRNIAQIARRLGRMRKLTKTDIKGERLEYNPLEHEMLGGHRSGVRVVMVVRDGIKKNFSGHNKTIVKPWVEPEE